MLTIKWFMLNVIHLSIFLYLTPIILLIIIILIIGFLKVTAFGKGDKNGNVGVELYFPTDPGYRDTVSSFILLLVY